MAKSNLVFKGNADVDCAATHTPRHSNHPYSSNDKGEPSSGSADGADGLQVVWEHYKGQELSQQATSIIMESWRDATKCQYKSYIKKWISYCTQWEVHHISPPLNKVLEFLTQQYMQGMSYSAINTCRSALSAMGIRIDSSPVGSHPIVCRFLKGVYNLRPPQARYIDTWDIDTVLSYLKKLSPANKLTIKELTYKTTMLVAIVTAARVDTLYKMSSNYKKQNDEFVFGLCCPLKHNRPGNNVKPIKLQGYPPDRALCVVTYLEEYLKRTKNWRTDTNKRLFVCTRLPHEDASKATLVRWIKETLSSAGIDVNRYKAHSVRPETVYKAVNKSFPISDILKTGGWSKESTFRKYYSKELSNPTFQEVVLNNCMSNMK